MTRHDSPPQILSLTGDSTIRHRETVFSGVDIIALVDENDEVNAGFRNPFFGAESAEHGQTVVCDTPADALRVLADLIEEVADG